MLVVILEYLEVEHGFAFCRQLVLTYRLMLSQHRGAVHLQPVGTVVVILQQRVVQLLERFVTIGQVSPVIGQILLLSLIVVLTLCSG